MSRTENGNHDSDALGHVIIFMCIAHHGYFDRFNNAGNCRWDKIIDIIGFRYRSG